MHNRICDIRESALEFARARIPRLEGLRALSIRLSDYAGGASRNFRRHNANIHLHAVAVGRGCCAAARRFRALESPRLVVAVILCTHDTRSRARGRPGIPASERTDDTPQSRINAAAELVSAAAGAPREAIPCLRFNVVRRVSERGDSAIRLYRRQVGSLGPGNRVPSIARCSGEESR